ncbi:hypothetical protein V6N12_042972 [Hibiscus sabdariffa]|uniref:Uncharacterized protein n=1 Tax=Hibiscus sabdariffa TaxID=183260 RepID=A0ABR2DHW0_9ROSI
MDAPSQEIEETSKKIENHMKLIFNILHIRPQQLAQGDSEIPNREEDRQFFGVAKQTAQNLSPIAQENSLCDTEIVLSSDTDDTRQKQKNNAKLVPLELTNKFLVQVKSVPSRRLFAMRVQCHQVNPRK